MSGVWDDLLEEHGKNIKTVLDFGAGKLRNSLYFVNEGKQVTAVEFEELYKNSKDGKKMLEKCSKKNNFKHLIFPYPFITDRQTYDLTVLVNVIPVMPIFAERLMLLDLLYDRVNENKFILWYTMPEGEYRKIREKGDNDFGDGLWMGEKNRFKTFYKFHNREDVVEMFSLFGFKFVKTYRASNNYVTLFQKTEHNLLRGILTPEKVISVIPNDENFGAPSVKFKRVKRTNKIKEIIPDPHCFSIEKLYSDSLKLIPKGANGAEKYHRLVSQIILRIFRGSLRNMEIKFDMFRGLKVIDTVYTNAGGFFTQIANTSNIKIPYVLLEAKNYTFDLGNPEFDQIAGRLIDDIGQFGLLVCRTADDKEAVKKHSEAILSDNHKHVILD